MENNAENTKCAVCEGTYGVANVGTYKVCTTCLIEGNDSINNYYYKPTPKFNGRHNRYFGVELEVLSGVQSSPGKGLAAALVNKAMGDLAYLKKDGSINGFGFEIVTHPFTFGQMYHKRPFSALKGLPLQSFNNPSTGIHVHVSRKGLTHLQLAKLVYFFAQPKNEKFLKYIGQRDWNDYCRKHQKGKMKADLNSHDRYKAVNFCNETTIEFRFFKGNAKPFALYRAVEFCNAILDFCAETSAHKLNWREFKKWMGSVSYLYKIRNLKNYVDKFNG